MAIEDTIIASTEPIKFALLNFLSVFVFDLEKILGLVILFIIGLIIAKWGKNLIAGLLKRVFSNKRLQEITKITPATLKENKGWNSFIYNIPDLFRIFILILIVSVALDLLEFEQASGLVGQVFTFLPNLIAVVLLLWAGSWLHNLGKEWFEGTKDTAFKGDTNVPKYGFYIILWGIIISISLTQLGIGGEIIPIIVAGIMGALVLTIYGLKDSVEKYLTVESLKQQGIKVGDIINFQGSEHEILDIGFSHIKLQGLGKKLLYVQHSVWTKQFHLTPETK